MLVWAKEAKSDAEEIDFLAHIDAVYVTSSRRRLRV